MASTKRKADHKDEPSKGRVVSERANKRPRKEIEAQSEAVVKKPTTDVRKTINRESKPAIEDKKAKRDDKNAAKFDKSSTGVEARPDRKQPKPSVLKQEESAFPRGGGSVLTPIERKQIQIQATQDALFEESGQKVSRPDINSEEDEGHGESDDATATKSKRKNLPKSKANTKDKGKKGDSTSDTEIRVEGLKSKRLVPGCLVLGQVSSITSQDVVLDLPNNLTGIIPMTGISALLTQKLEALAEKMEIEDDDQSTDGSDDINPKDLFYPGQYLRACVTSGGDDSDSKDTTKAKKKTILSIDPRQTNTGFTAKTIAINSMVQASVHSVEDHGLVMSLGLQEGSVKGFMSSKEIPDGMDYSRIREGTVFLCLVTGLSSNGNVVKLSASHKKAGDIRKSTLLNEMPTVDTLLPGTAVEMLVSQVSVTGLAGKVLGSIDATADVVHSGAQSRHTNIEAKYKVGSKIKTRIIFSTTEGDNRLLGVSILDHVMALGCRRPLQDEKPIDPLAILPVGTVVEECKVINVDVAHGLYIDVAVKGIPAFVHISRVSDDRVESLSPDSGAYRAGSVHRARVIAYNAMDSLFLASLQKTVLEQPYLRHEDVPVGALVKCTVERLVINAQGKGGVILNIAQGISGLVPEIHMADIHLQHPEKKFKNGVAITARVQSVDIEKRQIRLTLKKSLVNTDVQLLSKWEDVVPNTRTVGTILKLMPQGALLQFFGDVRGFLPVSEMSDAYIDDPTKHFRIGQVLSVSVTSVTPDENRMLVSCRTSPGTEMNAAGEAAFHKVQLADLVSGVVTEKSADTVTLNLKDSPLKATIKLGQLTDGSEKKNLSAMKQIRVGQSLQDLVVIELFQKRHSIVVSNKPSLVKATKTGTIVTKFADLTPGLDFNGFVRNVTAEGIFVQSVGNLTGLVHKSNVSNELLQLPDFGVVRDKTISAKVLALYPEQERFTLTMKEHTSTPARTATESPEAANNPVDGSSSFIADFVPGKLTKARIVSVKDTQLNVQLADNVQGRVDVSEIFSSWDDIKDRKHPLRGFRGKQEIDVKVLGVHDARNHRFLPISHRLGKVSVFELSAKVKDGKSIVTLDQVEEGATYTAFVNNITDNCLWVNLSPNVRGRIARMDIAEDVSLLNDLDKNFPIGCALQVKVKHVDLPTGRLDLSAKSLTSTPLTYEDLKIGIIVTGRVTKVTERAVLVQLSGSVAGVVGLTDIADDYEEADPTRYQKNEIVRVCVLDVDKTNKRVTLSTRPSKVLSSKLAVKDALITTPTQLKLNSIVRGFVKNVADVGLFVSLSHNVTAFVRVAEMADEYMKDWKSNFEVDRLVEGKIITVDATTGRVQMSLKPSVVSDDYVPLLSLSDLAVGQIVTGKVRKVEEFGVFIVIDHSHNVSGLCHRSEMAEQRIEDARKVYSEGDVVKAKVLKIEADKRRVSFGLKVSYFADDSDDVDDDDSNGGIDIDGASSVDGADEEDDDDDDDHLHGDKQGVALSTTEFARIAKAPHEDDDEDANDDDDDDDDESSQDDASGLEPAGLDAGGFDWSGGASRSTDAALPSSSSLVPAPTQTKKKKPRQPAIKVDETGTLDAHGPQTGDDFERLLLGARDSSALWTGYMEHVLRLGDVDGARRVADRALASIDVREQDEKRRVWAAYLALENGAGDEAALERVFERACAHADAREMHDELASIYILSGEHEVSFVSCPLLQKARSMEAG